MTTMAKHACRRGISLVELLIGLAISAMVMVPLVPMLATSAQAARITAERRAIERDASFALKRIAAQVRATSPALLSPQANSDTSGDWFSGVTYHLAGSRLLETRSGIDYVLADAVTAFSITAPTVGAGTPVIEVSLTLATPGGASTSASAVMRMGSAL